MKINKIDRCLSREDFGVILRNYYVDDNIDVAYDDYCLGVFSYREVILISRYDFFVESLAEAEDKTRKIRLLQEALSL